MMAMLTFEQVDARANLERDGFVIVDLLDTDSVSLLLDLHAKFSARMRGDFIATPMIDDHELQTLVASGAGAVLGPRLHSVFMDAKLVGCGFAVKKGQRRAGLVPLHQDATFVDETRFASLNIWCPLRDVDIKNGALVVVKGSHRCNRRPRPAYARFPYPDLLHIVRDGYLAVLKMRAGQAVVYNPSLWHGSGVNLQPQDRVAVVAVVADSAAQLLCFHHDGANRPRELEIFEVPDDFYVGHVAGTRPRRGTSRGHIVFETPDLTPDGFREACRPAR